MEGTIIMAGTMAEIRIFAGTYAPNGWMFCRGQQLSIANYNTLYSLIGTVYGGDGIRTFALPNLAGRVAVGTGQGVGLSKYSLGYTTGDEQVTLTPSQIAIHTHQATLYGGGNNGAINALCAIWVSSSGSGFSSPSGAILGNDPNALVYKNMASGPVNTTPMSAGAISINGVSSQTYSSTDYTGVSEPHENLQPYLAMNYIICVEGTFPIRN